MQAGQTPVCNIGLFGEGVENFWAGTASNLLERYPMLEFPHESTFYMLLIIEQASGQIFIDNDKIPLEEAQVIVIKPNCINHIYLNRNAVGKVLCFTEDFFSLRYNNNVLSQFSLFDSGSRSLIRVTTEKLSFLNTLMQLTSDEFGNYRKESSKALRSYLNIILIELERLQGSVKTSCPNDPSQEKLQKFQKLVEKNFREMKLPSEYADMLNISTNYLNKICKKRLGKTSGDLIRNQLIIEAKRLLHYTSDNINEIAAYLGFEHTSYFITFFRKSMDQTPEQFRKKQQEE